MPDILVTGRLVKGHPMEMKPRTDDAGKPKVGPTGVVETQAYIGVAIPKAGEAHWHQTAWGQVARAEAMAGWPAGEHNAPTFAWKVVDGDSMVPNRKGTIPARQEGFPGHWIINCQTSIPVKCFHAGKYNPIDQIQNPREIKTGDYCRVSISVKHNNPAKSPGIYMNPVLFELSRPGVEIFSGPDAAAVFGGAAPAYPPAGAPAYPPAGAPAYPPAGAPAYPPAGAPAAAPPPHPAILDPANEKFIHTNGSVFDRAALLGSGWNNDQINALPRA